MQEKNKKLRGNGKYSYDELGYECDKCTGVAAHVNTQFRNCVTNRRLQRAGGHSVEDHLWYAYWQSEDQHEPCDLELIEETGVDVYLPVTSVKVSVVHAFARDMVNTNKNLIRFQPSAEPELTEQDEREIVRELRQEIQTLKNPELEVVDAAKLIKDKYFQKVIQRASKAANVNTRKMRDKLEETRFNYKLIKFLQYLLYYPYAISLFPVDEKVVDYEWQGDKYKIVEKIKKGTRIIDPFDYYWSGDCTEPGKGYCEIVIDHFSRCELDYFARNGNKYWDKEALQGVIEHFSKVENYNWLRPGIKSKRKVSPVWGSTDTIEGIRYFGRMPTETIKEYNPELTFKDNELECEVSVIVIGRYVVRFEVIDTKLKRKRPTLVSNWQDKPDRIDGKGLGYILRDIQRQANMSARHTITNAGYASAPGGEYDPNRTAEYDDDDGPKQMIPGRLLPAKSDPMGTNQNAYRFYNLPDNLTQFTNLQSYYLQLADNVSQIPALLSGVPVGSGAMRTFRGMMQYQANAMRVIQGAFDNVDRDFLQPIGEYYLSEGLKNKEFSGDCDAIVHGLGGLLREELDAQKAAENLQLITQLAGAVPEKVPPGSLDWVIKELLGKSGIPD